MNYPDIKVELNVDYSMADIVTQRFHPGVRFLVEQIAKNMVGVRIEPDLRIIVVGSPQYFAKFTIPCIPQALLTPHGIHLRLPTHDSFLLWEFQKQGQWLRIPVQGQLAFIWGHTF